MKEVSMEQFIKLSKEKKIYYLSRLFIHKDVSGKYKDIPYKNRLFMVMGWLKKQEDMSLGMLYRYLLDHEHQNNLWEILPQAELYDQKLRREHVEGTNSDYGHFNLSMLSDE